MTTGSPSSTTDARRRAFVERGVLKTHLAGAQYRDKASQMWLAEAGQRSKVILCRERNPHDENAIGVHLSSPTGRLLHIGYVPRVHAAYLGPMMDAGTYDLYCVLGDPHQVDEKHRRVLEIGIMCHH